MELHTITIIVLFFILVINVVSTFLFFKIKIGYTKKQKIFQLLIIWCIPIIGAILILSLRKSISEPALTPEQHRKRREMIKSNEDSLHNSS